MPLPWTPSAFIPTARVLRVGLLTANRAVHSYLSAPEDIARLVRGIRLILRISKEAPLPARLDLADASPMLDSALDAQSDAALAVLVRARVEAKCGGMSAWTCCIVLVRRSRSMRPIVCVP